MSNLISNTNYVGFLYQDIFFVYFMARCVMFMGSDHKASNSQQFPLVHVVTAVVNRHLNPQERQTEC